MSVFVFIVCFVIALCAVTDVFRWAKMNADSNRVAAFVERVRQSLACE